MNLSILSLLVVLISFITSFNNSLKSMVTQLFFLLSCSKHHHSIFILELLHTVLHLISTIFFLHARSSSYHHNLEGIQRNIFSVCILNGSYRGVSHISKFLPCEFISLTSFSPFWKHFILSGSQLIFLQKQKLVFQKLSVLYHLQNSLPFFSSHLQLRFESTWTSCIRTPLLLTIISLTHLLS